MAYACRFPGVGAYVDHQGAHGTEGFLFQELKSSCIVGHRGDMYSLQSLQTRWPRKIYQGTKRSSLLNLPCLFGSMKETAVLELL